MFTQVQQHMFLTIKPFHTLRDRYELGQWGVTTLACIRITWETLKTLTLRLRLRPIKSLSGDGIQASVCPILDIQIQWVCVTAEGIDHFSALVLSDLPVAIDS